MSEVKEQIKALNGIIIKAEHTFEEDAKYVNIAEVLAIIDQHIVSPEAVGRALAGEKILIDWQDLTKTEKAHHNKIAKKLAKAIAADLIQPTEKGTISGQEFLDTIEERLPIRQPKPITENDEKIKLWAHCVSEHTCILSPEVSLSDLRDYHENEHNGPCTIRNHDKKNLNYSLKKIGQVLSEHDE